MVKYKMKAKDYVRLVPLPFRLAAQQAEAVTHNGRVVLSVREDCFFVYLTHRGIAWEPIMNMDSVLEVPDSYLGRYCYGFENPKHREILAMKG